MGEFVEGECPCRRILKNSLKAVDSVARNLFAENNKLFVEDFTTSFCCSKLKSDLAYNLISNIKVSLQTENCFPVETAETST